MRRALLCLPLLWLLVSPCRAAAPAPLLVVVLMPGTTLTQWREADTPHLHSLMATGALAVMNTRTARLPSDHVREPPESAALTLGAGSRAAGGSELTDFQPAASLVPGVGITAGALWARRTENLLPPAHTWVNVNWPRVLRENAGQGYDVSPGNLGDALAARGILCKAGGGPLAFPVACHSDGTVDASEGGPPGPPSLGGGGSTAEFRFTHPSGNRAQQDKHTRTSSPQTWGAGGSCLIWDAGGDLTAADATLGTLSAQVNARRGRLLVLSPTVNNTAYARGERLAPVLEWGDGIAPGLLYSPSTRRAGLVTNTDFAPTVAAFFGATLAVPAFGRSWQARPTPNPLEQVARLEAEAYRQARAMRALPSLAILLGLALLAGTFCVLTGRAAEPLFLLPSVLLLSLTVSGSGGELALWLAGMSAALAVLRRWAAWETLLTAVAGLLVFTLAGDMLAGDPLMRRVLLGYSATEGARYYGMGNEAMGALVGAALVLASRLWGEQQRAGRILITAGLAGMALLLGLPAAGAKAGGLIVAAASFSLLLWRLWGGHWNGRTVLGALAVAATLLALVSVGDARRGAGEQTHMGQAVRRIGSGGAGEAADIAARKLAVEWRLLYHSAWAVPLWAGMSGLFLLRRRARQPDRERVALASAGGLAVALCLAVNDAGAVAGALCGALVWSGLAQDTEKKARAE